MPGSARDDTEAQFSDHYRAFFSDSPDMSQPDVAKNTRQDGGQKKPSYAAAASLNNNVNGKSSEKESEQERRQKHFYIRGLSDDVDEKDVVDALEKFFNIKAENIYHGDRQQEI